MPPGAIRYPQQGTLLRYIVCSQRSKFIALELYNLTDEQVPVEVLRFSWHGGR